jgi:hypothetical protein
MRSFLILGSILAALVVWLFSIAPDSHAYSEVRGITEVRWSGSHCVQIYGAAVTNPYLIGSPVWQCDGGNGTHAASWVEYRGSGQVIGIDPEMGDNDWISCTLWVDGRVEYSDSATAGNGHQVNCIRVVN